MTVRLLALQFFAMFLPALMLALCMPWLGRRVMGPGGAPWAWRSVAHLLCGMAVLLAGLWWSGSDGAMLTYLALMTVSGGLEWALHRGWQR